MVLPKLKISWGREKRYTSRVILGGGIINYRIQSSTTMPKIKSAQQQIVNIASEQGCLNSHYFIFSPCSEIYSLIISEIQISYIYIYIYIDADKIKLLGIDKNNHSPLARQGYRPGP